MDHIQQRHKVSHIPSLRVDPDLVKARFPAGCSMTRCVGKCCRDGVWMDPTEQSKILSHVALIQEHMDPAQEKNPARWFDDHRPNDSDFPSGRAIGTAVANGACVFLNAEKRCVLQLAGNAEVGSLKPFFCFAFPITIDHGLLCLDDGRDAACCVEDPSGPLTVMDLCPYELTYVLGEDGVAELQKKVVSGDLGTDS